MGGAAAGIPESLGSCASRGTNCFVYFSAHGLCFPRDSCAPQANGCEYGIPGHESWEFTTYIKKEQPQWGGRLRWFGSETCYALGLDERDQESYAIGMQECSRYENSTGGGSSVIWQHNGECGNVVEMFRFGNWEKYLGVVEKEDAPGLGGDVSIGVGQLYAVLNPGYPVPCDVGAKISLFPQPPPPQGPFGDGCLSEPSPPFQIQSSGKISGCATVKDNELQGNEFGVRPVKVEGCRSNDMKQLFTLQTQGCD